MEIKNSKWLWLVAWIGFGWFSLQEAQAQAFGYCRCATHLNEQNRSIQEIFEDLKILDSTSQLWFVDLTQGKISLGEAQFFPYESQTLCVQNILRDCWGYCELSARNVIRSSFPKTGNFSSTRRLSEYLKLETQTLCTLRVFKPQAEEPNCFRNFFDFPFIFQEASPFPSSTLSKTPSYYLFLFAALILTSLVALVSFPVEAVGGVAAAILLAFGFSFQEAPKGFHVSPVQWNGQGYSTTIQIPGREFRIEVDPNFQRAKIIKDRKL